MTQAGWRAQDEWMDEYRDAASRGNREQDLGSVRPGMAPAEEALIQVALLHAYLIADAAMHMIPLLARCYVHCPGLF